MSHKRFSILIIVDSMDQADQTRAKILAATLSPTSAAKSLADWRSFARSPDRLQDFTHFAFFSGTASLTREQILRGVELIDGDEMTLGFQTGWVPSKDTQLIPFLKMDAFCVKRKFSVDFEMISEGIETFSSSSYLANRCGFRFIGLPTDHSKILAPVTIQGPHLSEAQRVMDGYLGSPDYLWGLFQSEFHSNKRRIFFDLDHCIPGHNGTNTCVLQILKNAYSTIQHCEVTVHCSVAVWEFLELAKHCPGWRHTDHIDPETSYEIGFILGQPWKIERIRPFNQMFHSIYFLIFDSIAWDCLYIRYSLNDLDRLWKFWSEYANGFVFISEFTKRIFLSRFPEANSASHHVALLSTHSQDYSNDEITITEGDYYLIFGNFYAHKFIAPTVDQLDSLLKGDERILVVGKYDGPANERITQQESGNLTDEEIARLYSNAKAVIYPSQYEGFGLPIAEALSRGKTVFARDSSLLRELITHWKGPGKLIAYSDNLDLVEKFQLFQSNNATPVSGSGTHENSWRSISPKIMNFVITDSESSKAQSRTQKRFRNIDLFENILGILDQTKQRQR